MARGRLRIYLGAAPGVGKTYAMLSEGHRRTNQGDDCVIALVESHARKAIEAMAIGLELVPRRTIAYRGAQLTEMDLDAVLGRRPRVVLVDELAHTNAPGSRHLKRWQDVEELLDAGIDVISTLNVQHLESLNDVVAGVTGTRQGETIPDDVVRRADEIELVDLSPEALRRRMVAGSIYPPDRIDAALSHYFRPGNLTALRELALLWLADRVEEGLMRYREVHGIAAPWEARERVVVGVSGGPGSDRLIRRAALLADRMPGSDLLAVHVAQSDGRIGPDAASLARWRALVESVGGSWHQVVGSDVTGALAAFVRHENATQLIVGADAHSTFVSLLTGHHSVSRGLSRLGGTLDVHVVPEGSPSERRTLRMPPVGGFGGPDRRHKLAALAMAGAALPVLTVLLAHLRGDLGASADTACYLLIVVGVGAIGGLAPALPVAVASAALVGYYFVPPTHSVDAATDFVVLAAFMLAGATASWTAGLAARRRAIATRATAEAAAMSAMAGAALRGEDDLPRLLELIRETFGFGAVSVLERPPYSVHDEAPWTVLASSGDRPPESPHTSAVAPAPSEPLIVAGRGPDLSNPDQQVFTALAALVVEAVQQRRLLEEAASAKQRATDEHHRMDLLSAANRALGRRVARAQRALSSLRAAPTVSGPDREELLDTIESSLGRISAVVGELSYLAQARAGAVDVHLRPVDVAEVIAAGLEELGPDRHRLDIQVPDDLPDAIADSVVLARVIVVLAANSLRQQEDGWHSRLAATAIPPDQVEINFEEVPPTSGMGDTDRDVPAETSPGRDEVRGGLAALGLDLARALVETIGGTVRTDCLAGRRVTTVRLVAANQPTGQTRTVR